MVKGPHLEEAMLNEISIALLQVIDGRAEEIELATRHHDWEAVEVLEETLDAELYETCSIKIEELTEKGM